VVPEVVVMVRILEQVVLVQRGKEMQAVLDMAKELPVVVVVVQVQQELAVDLELVWVAWVFQAQSLRVRVEFSMRAVVMEVETRQLWREVEAILDSREHQIQEVVVGPCRAVQVEWRAQVDLVLSF
jgi:hypothetical protein